MHGWNGDVERLAENILAYAQQRLALDPLPLDNTRPLSELQAQAGSTITASGLGGEEALRIFADVLAPACITANHPRFLAFIPCAPTEASMLFDLVVGASSMCGSNWLEAAGATYAENQALRWIADLAGFPPGAGGTFVQGGTIANISALVTARHAVRDRMETSHAGAQRWAVAVSPDVHSSLSEAAEVMDVDLVVVRVDDDQRLRGAELARVLDAVGSRGDQKVFAVVASAGTTNLGVIDDLRSVGTVAAERGIWFHVDGAYGAAALAAPSARQRFAGIELADSFIVDPHKWLFAPFDCAALIYREPELARATHAQHASYLEPLAQTGEWNPADYAIHLTRRARGLPFWFSLATYGTNAYSQALERTLEVARYTAKAVQNRDYLTLVREPELSVVCFRRTGWTRDKYDRWSQKLRDDGIAFVTPTTHLGEVMARVAIVNPQTSESDIDAVLDSMA
ncbi:MAG TPA: pyridoxal-dependent decarboxylase [Acidimicrobiales bacterium]|nr:pyridoxal-dependent decarboxylase [Acidimicrobiales bacterium]